MLSLELCLCQSEVPKYSTYLLDSCLSNSCRGYVVTQFFCTGLLLACYSLPQGCRFSQVALLCWKTWFMFTVVECES